MKKRILCIALALLMVLALLPFGALAADLSGYQEVLNPLFVRETPDYPAPAEEYTINGTYRDLNGDQTPELILLKPYGDAYAVDIYTLQNGKAVQIFHEMFNMDNPEFEFVAVLQGKDGKTLIMINAQSYEEAFSDDYGDWYYNTLVNRMFSVNGTEIKAADKTSRSELRTLPDNDGNYYTIPDECRYMINNQTVSEEKYYSWYDSYFDAHPIVLEVETKDPIDGYSAKQLLTVAKGGFVDVPAKQYYAKPVAWAVEQGITKGTSQMTFSPNDPCTRGQIVTFLWRAAGSPEPASTKNPFKDVKKSDYYYKAVLWAVERGITMGTSATTFEPGSPCTRGQVVTFLYRNAGTPAVKAKNPFGDVKSSAYYYDAVLWAVKNEITQGTSATTFSPAQTCTRAQIVTFLYRGLAE